MIASNRGPTQHPGLVPASMTPANAVVLVDQTALPLTLAEIMPSYVGSQKAQWVLNASLPGLLLYGGGLAIVLTVNDPVSLSDVPEAAEGQAAGVSATAEQFGGALGIAVLYLIFHTTYVA